MSDDTDIYEAMREEARENRERKREHFLTSVLPKVQEYAETYGLTVRKLTDYQYRVQNGKGQFVDLWTTRAMRNINGRTSGFGYAENNLWREIEKLRK